MEAESEEEERRPNIPLDESSSSSDSGDDDLGTSIESRRPTDQHPSGSTRGGSDNNTASSITKRRGESRAHSHSRSLSGKKKIFFVGDSLLAENGISEFFCPQIRNELDGNYTNWVNVPTKNKNRIWELFLKEWSLEGYDPNFVYNKFMQQNGVKYRKFLSELKQNQMRAHKYKDEVELLDKSKPSFMKSAQIWEQYVRHWCSLEKRTRSYINKKDRAAREGSSHGYGRKSVAAHLHEMEEQGKKLSMLSVMIDVNKKRDKKNNPTGEVHHRELQTAIDEYREKHKAAFGPELNPEEEELNIGLWKSTGEVARRMSQGRVLGIGSCNIATAIFRPTVNANIAASVEIQSQLEELRRK